MRRGGEREGRGGEKGERYRLDWKAGAKLSTD